MARHHFEHETAVETVGNEAVEKLHISLGRTADVALRREIEPELAFEEVILDPQQRHVGSGIRIGPVDPCLVPPLVKKFPNGRLEGADNEDVSIVVEASGPARTWRLGETIATNANARHFGRSDLDMRYINSDITNAQTRFFSSNDG